MSDAGIEEIKKRIAQNTVYTPADYDLEKIEVWVNGYKTCMGMVMGILNSFKEER